MSEMERGHAHSGGGQESSEPIRYPTNHVLGVVATADRVAATVEALTSGGFLETEVHVNCGSEAAERLRASSGRSGLAGMAIRVAERLGLADTEMENKGQYERALQEGQFVVLVAAPTDERKDVASRILHAHGATLVRYFGRFAMEDLAPPGT